MVLIKVFWAFDTTKLKLLWSWSRFIRQVPKSALKRHCLTNKVISLKFLLSSWPSVWLWLYLHVSTTTPSQVVRFKSGNHWFCKAPVPQGYKPVRKLNKVTHRAARTPKNISCLWQNPIPHESESLLIVQTCPALGGSQDKKSVLTNSLVLASHQK